MLVLFLAAVICIYVALKLFQSSQESDKVNKEIVKELLRQKEAIDEIKNEIKRK